MPPLAENDFFYRFYTIQLEISMRFPKNHGKLPPITDLTVCQAEKTEYNVREISWHLPERISKMLFPIHKPAMKRTCILIWIAAILLSACGQAKGTTETETEPGTDTEAVVETEAETETTRMDVDDGLPEADFEDRSYRIVSYDYIICLLYTSDAADD